MFTIASPQSLGSKVVLPLLPVGSLVTVEVGSLVDPIVTVEAVLSLSDADRVVSVIELIELIVFEFELVFCPVSLSSPNPQPADNAPMTGMTSMTSGEKNSPRRSPGESLSIT
jgi:hypothetical protein